MRTKQEARARLLELLDRGSGDLTRGEALGLLRCLPSIREEQIYFHGVAVTALLEGAGRVVRWGDVKSIVETGAGLYIQESGRVVNFAELEVIYFIERTTGGILAEYRVCKPEETALQEACDGGAIVPNR